jgi:hypothetical protein
MGKLVTEFANEAQNQSVLFAGRDHVSDNPAEQGRTNVKFEQRQDETRPFAALVVILLIVAAGGNGPGRTRPTILASRLAADEGQSVDLCPDVRIAPAAEHRGIRITKRSPPMGVLGCSDVAVLVAGLVRRFAIALVGMLASL